MPVYLPPAVGQGHTGVLLIAKNNAGTPGTVRAFPAALINPGKTNNNSYPALVDGSATAHNKVPGKREGSLRANYAVQLDRDVAGFLTDYFGPGGNTDCFVDVVPFSGGGTEIFNLCYVNQAVLYARDGQRGQDTEWMMDVQIIVVDPDNAVNTRTALAAPTSVGTNGLGISTFIGSTLSDGAATPTIYDVQSAVSLTLMNRFVRIPGTVPGTRYGAGCKRGQMIGALTAGQTHGAANPVPAGGGNYPFTISIPTGDGSKHLKVDLSVSDDDTGQQIAPTSFVGDSEVYTVFGSNAGNTTAAANGGLGWPMVATYA